MDSNFCETDEDGNIIDPISGDLIPPERIIHVLTGQTSTFLGKIICFDIESLLNIVNYAEKKGKIPENPFTREPLDSKTLKKVKAYENTFLRNLLFYWYIRATADPFQG